MDATRKTRGKSSPRPSGGGCSRPRPPAPSEWASPPSSATSPRLARGSPWPEEAPRLEAETGREGARKLSEADLEKRPAATLPEGREFLRAAWRAMLAGSIEEQTASCWWTSVGRTPRSARCTPGRAGASGRRAARHRATGGATSSPCRHLAGEHDALPAQ